MLKVCLVTENLTKIGGLSRYERSLSKELSKKIKLKIIPITDLQKDSFITKIVSFFKQVILKEKDSQQSKIIFHLANQQLAALLCFKKLRQAVVTAHDITPHIKEYETEFSRLTKLKYHVAMVGLKMADQIITDAKFTKNELIKYLSLKADKIDVVPLGVDTHLFRIKKVSLTFKRKYKIPDNTLIILYTGSEIARMNLPTLISALAILKNKMNKIILVKVGEPQVEGARDKLIELIKAKNLEKQVIFVGYVPETELPLFYNAADLFVYPIIYTGFGLPVLEAMACGCPVISSNSSSLPEVGGNAVLYFNPTDAGELAEKMYKVLTDEKLRKALARKGLKRAKQFTWEKTAQKTIQTYKRLSE